MRKIHMKKRTGSIFDADAALIVCENTFSVRNVLMSALLNLFEYYGNTPNYFIALGDFIAFPEMRRVAGKFVADQTDFPIGPEALDETDDADDIVRLFRRKLAASRTPKALYNIAGMLTRDAATQHHFFTGTVSAVSPMDKIAAFFSLSETETRTMAFLACWTKARHFDDLCDDVAEGQSREEALKFLARSIRTEPHEVNAAIRKLKEKKIVEASRRRFPELTDEIEEFIFEYDGGDLAQKFSATLNLKKVFPTGSFEVEKEDIEIITKLLAHEDGAHILLHGKPGSGKTEFAKSIAEELGKAVFVPARKNEKKNSLSPVKINATLFAAKNGNGIALIDEADDFLETAPRRFSLFGGSGNNLEKACVNTLLDESRAPVIWITNSIAGIDESTRRRFAYTLEFSGVSDRQKRLVLGTVLRENNISERLSEAIFPLVRQYSLSPAGISLSVKNAKIVSEDSEEKLLGNIKRIAQNHYSLITGKEPSEKMLSVDSGFDSELLNTNPPIGEITKSIENYRTAASRAGKALPLAMLFSGAPGTGKTQLGRYIARLLDKEILIRRISDIKSPFVGITEQNIAAAFREADRNDQVLMIDEADSLFLDRRMTTHSWEVSETNEILAQMEIFKGVFICTTNLLGNFDPASMRRFHRKIEFRPLSADGRIKIFRRYFPQLCVDDDVLARETASLEGLCPGDFCAVRERIRYDDSPTAENIFCALRDELRYKTQESARAPIGFL